MPTQVAVIHPISKTTYMPPTLAIPSSAALSDFLSCSWKLGYFVVFFSRIFYKGWEIYIKIKYLEQENYDKDVDGGVVKEVVAK